MKEKFIRNFKQAKLIKAIKANNPIATPSTGTGKTFPVGTIRNGRQKVSANPSKWIDASTGKSYSTHDDAKHHTVDKHEELSGIKKNILSKLKEQNVESSALSNIEHKLDKYLQSKLHSKNIMSVSNIESSRTGTIVKDYQDRFFRMSEETNKLKEDFLTAIKQAKKKVG